MSSYLPKDGGSGSAYQEGGGLYALGKQLVLVLRRNLKILVNVVVNLSIYRNKTLGNIYNYKAIEYIRNFRNIA